MYLAFLAMYILFLHQELALELFNVQRTSLQLIIKKYCQYIFMLKFVFLLIN